MDIIIPNLQWYLGQSTSKGTPRCPFANVQKCPRFYQSVSLLGEAGSTKIPEKEDKKLLKKWERSPLWPVTDEQATSIAGSKDNYKHFRNFCPEVSYEHFGLFASHLYEYADELDVDLAHSQLSKIKATSDDWRWSWSNIQPLHYSECPLYSVLLSLKTDSQNKYEDIIEKNKYVGLDKYVVIGIEVVLLIMFLLSLEKDVIIHFRKHEGDILASVTRGEQSMTALYWTFGIVISIYTLAVQHFTALKRNKVLIIILNYIALIYLFFFSSWFRNSIFFPLLKKIMTD